MGEHEKSIATFDRRMHMLGIFKGGETLTAKMILDRLEYAGDDISERSVQRGLEMLVNGGYLEVVNPGGKPLQWRWPKGKKPITLPRMAHHEVLAFRLLERFLKSLLPRETYEALRPYFSMAERELDRLPGWAPLRYWESKVQILPPNQPLLPPEPVQVAAEDRDQWWAAQQTLRDTLLAALFEGRQCDIEYQQLWRDEPVRWTIHPFVFVQRGPAFYLLCNIDGFEDVRSLVLHRMLSVRAKSARASPLKSFGVKDEAEAVRNFQGLGGSGEAIRLIVRFYRSAGLHLLETRLSEDQVVQDRDGDNDHLRLTATVNDTAQLRRWLLSFGSNVEVLEPVELRAEMTRNAYWMHQAYSKPPD